jgi:hypothetical protein
MMIADRAAEPLHASDVGAVGALVRLPVAAADAPDARIVERAIDAGEPVAVRFGVVVGQRDDVAAAGGQRRVHRGDHPRCARRDAPQRHAKRVPQAVDAADALGIIIAQADDDLERRHGLRREGAQATLQRVRAAPGRHEDGDCRHALKMHSGPVSAKHGGSGPGGTSHSPLAR